MMRLLRRLFHRHDWQHYQHSVAASEYYDKRVEFVIAFKVCKQCAASRLIHLLE